MADIYGRYIVGFWLVEMADIYIRYIVIFWLVEMAIPTNQKHMIYRNLYENTLWPDDNKQVTCVSARRSQCDHDNTRK